MRENRPYGSEGGVGESPSLPLSKLWGFGRASARPNIPHDNDVCRKDV